MRYTLHIIYNIKTQKFTPFAPFLPLLSKQKTAGYCLRFRFSALYFNFIQIFSDFVKKAIHSLYLAQLVRRNQLSINYHIVLVHCPKGLE